MERRGFLKILFGLPMLGGIRAARAGDRPSRLVLQVSPLARFQFNGGPKVCKRLSVGGALTLVREPDNPYGARAVRVEWRGHILGYLRRVENAATSQRMDRGAHLTARIAWLREDPNPWKRVGVERGEMG